MAAKLTLTDPESLLAALQAGANSLDNKGGFEGEAETLRELADEIATATGLDNPQLTDNYGHKINPV